MDRIPRHRLALALAAAVVGIAAALAAPQLVAAGPTTPAAVETEVAPTAPFEIAPRGVPLEPITTLAPITTIAPFVATAAPVAPPAPVVTPTSEPAPVADAAPAPGLAAPTPPAPIAEEAPVTRTTGTLTVDVAPAEGATRYVSVRTTDGTTVAGPTPVGDEPVTISDVEAGSYEVFAEHFADGGGTFLTRTPITIAAGDHVVATCDAGSLDCSVD